MSKNRVIYQNWIVDLGGEPNKNKVPEFLSLDELLSTEEDEQLIKFCTLYTWAVVIYWIAYYSACGLSM